MLLNHRVTCPKCFFSIIATKKILFNSFSYHRIYRIPFHSRLLMFIRWIAAHSTYGILQGQCNSLTEKVSVRANSEAHKMKNVNF